VLSSKPSISYSRNSYVSGYQIKSSPAYVPHSQLQQHQGWNGNLYNQSLNDNISSQNNYGGSCQAANYDWSLASHNSNYNQSSYQMNNVDLVQYNAVPNNYQSSYGYYQQANNYQQNYSSNNQEYNNNFTNQKYSTPVSGYKNTRNQILYRFFLIFFKIFRAF